MPSALYVIDARVADFPSIIAALPQESKVLVLDATGDGLDQIAAFLAEREPADSLHIISHGASGVLSLGSTRLTHDKLDQYAGALARIGQGLTADGDILLYGCNVAQGEAGATFVDRLAALTGADVAASTDLTGSGGDWVLEAHGGSVEASTLAGLEDYAGTLDVFAGTTGDDSLAGTGGDDTLTGSYGNDTLDGGAGSDSLDGGSGNDSLIGGLGADSMAGGAGNDVYEVGNAADVVTENSYAGTDTVRSTVSFTLSANVENLELTGAAAVNGTGNDLANTIAGNAANNLLSGGGGNDTLRGGGGADTFAGGLGDDLFYVESASDVVQENATEGTDTVSSSVNHTLAANVENLILTGVAVSGVGNALANTLTGTSAGNVLSGGGGVDTLLGGDGDDSLTGGTGNDSLDGGAGVDTAQYSGLMAEYRFGVDASGQVTITDTNTANGNDGTDVLLGVEQVRSADGAVRVTGLQEVRVNTFTSGDQSAPAIATLADGGYVVVWQSYGQSGGFVGVHSQRYYADGSRHGIETLVNTTAYFDMNPDVVAISDGGYVVVWDGAFQNSWNICGQRYDASGVQQGGNIFLNTSTSSCQRNPVVTSFSDDGYVVAWNECNYGYDVDVFSQIFDMEGMALDEASQVNSYTINNQFSSDIADLADGGYVVVWQSYGATNGAGGVFSRRYRSDGCPQGTEAMVYATNNTWPCEPTVAALADGGYIVAWVGDGGTGSDICVHRYAVDGSSQSGEIRISNDDGTECKPSLVSLSDGGYVVSWEGYGEDSLLWDVYARRYAKDGSQIGRELRINTNIGQQCGSVVSDLGNGEYVVVWTDGAKDGSGSGVYSQRVDAYNNLLAAQLTGDAAANTLNWSGTGSVILDGGAGNDTLRGGDSPDQLRGGDGVDTADYSAAAAGIVADLVAGTAGDDHLSSIENIIGSAHDDSLSGNGGANLLSGLGGNDTLLGRLGDDTLLGGAGNDTLNGGVGNDSMVGGLGNDLYVVDSVGDNVEELPNQGADTVQSSINFTLGQDVEHLLLTGGAVNGSGNTLDNRLTGNAAANTLSGGTGNDTLLGNGGNDTLSGGEGNDTLSGGAGNDSMLGGQGNDVYVVDTLGDKVVELANQGVDTVQSSVTWQLGGNLEKLVLTGASAISGTGNALDNFITGNNAVNTLNGWAGNDTMSGWAGDDVLYGNQGNDILYGNAGNDILDGGTGNDSLYGGVGNDIYVVDSTDRITELAGQGVDTVRSSVTWTLGANLENLVLTGSADIAGLGNALANRITGNGAGNVLDGRAGADTLVGAGGHDTYYVDNSGDVVVELANQGSDVVISTVTHTLAANVEGLYLGGSAAINGAGNGLANLLRGNGAANILDGAAGADTLEGGLGRDTLTGGAGTDHFVFNTTLNAANIDAITDFTHAVDKIVLDDDIFTQVGAVGALNAAAFRKGTGVVTAGDADDRIILNTTTGALLYDADGNGANAAVQFATLTGTSAIGTVTASDFLVVA